MIARKVCESCGKEMEIIFILTNLPLNVISREQVLKPIHSNGQDIFQNKWWWRWLPSWARYVMGFKCASCKIMWLNYGKTYNEQEAQVIVQGD